MPEIQLHEEEPIDKEEMAKQLKMVKTVLRRMDDGRCPYCGEKWEMRSGTFIGRTTYYRSCPTCDTESSQIVYIKALKQAVNM